ncbi:hypothetical protein M405DRAFT_869690 [Rhizopogon salebrosus TDB-379]|nr:hypothetical protein M405DRAFT_869690 [Rhizopogon salebrosus TDB-379]
MSRKPSSATLVQNAPGRPLPPLAYSLERLSIGEDRLTNESIPLASSSFLRNLQKLEELYLSGNQLTSIPTEDLVKMTRLSILFLNGNQFQTLPAELGKIRSLTIIDAGSDLLRYNIHNLEFDWNWNFNSNLKYLNLSGNKKLDLKQNNGGKRVVDEDGRDLSDCSRLSQLRVLSDGYLTTLDLVVPEFGGRNDEALLAMFGEAEGGCTRRIAADILEARSTAPRQALCAVAHRQGASGIVVYVVGRALYVANVGRALAVISSHTNAELISKKYDP